VTGRPPPAPRQIADTGSESAIWAVDELRSGADPPEADRFES